MHRQVMHRIVRAMIIILHILIGVDEVEQSFAVSNTPQEYPIVVPGDQAVITAHNAAQLMVYLQQASILPHVYAVNNEDSDNIVVHSSAHQPLDQHETPLHEI